MGYGERKRKEEIEERIGKEVREQMKVSEEIVETEIRVAKAKERLEGLRRAREERERVKEGEDARQQQEQIAQTSATRDELARTTQIQVELTKTQAMDQLTLKQQSDRLIISQLWAQILR